MLGPGLAGECDCACGLHVNEDHLLLEVIDPETEEPLDYGEQGELVITTLTKEALPVFRYRTRDLTVAGPRALRLRAHARAHAQGAAAHRRHAHHPRRQRVPGQVEAVLAGIEGVQPHYLIVVDRKKNLDDLEVRVEVDETLFSDVMGDMVRFQRRVAERIQSELGLRARVTLVEPGAEAGAAASRRVLDLRQSD